MPVNKECYWMTLTSAPPILPPWSHDVKMVFIEKWTATSTTASSKAIPLKMSGEARHCQRNHIIWQLHLPKLTFHSRCAHTPCGIHRSWNGGPMDTFPSTSEYLNNLRGEKEMCNGLQGVNIWDPLMLTSIFILCAFPVHRLFLLMTWVSFDCDTSWTFRLYVCSHTLPSSTIAEEKKWLS